VLYLYFVPFIGFQIKYDDDDDICSVDVTFFTFSFYQSSGDQLSQNALDRSSPYFQDRYTYGSA